ncbi:MAG TPA: DUF6064 family protein [Caldimonas sp.]|nr:DUF6064 family protein [Caldimonas sp.]
MLPFTHQQFMLVFSVYNGAIWPLQPIVLAAGLVMLAFLAWPTPRRDKAGVVLLAALWIWTGLVYQIGFFSHINPIATAFGAAFVVQGALLLEAALRGRLRFATSSRLRLVTGWALFLYSLFVYPLIGIASDTSYIDLPAFGLAPCPVTLTTLGMLLLARSPVPGRLFVIPIAWALVGGSAAALLRMPQDWPLLLAPILLAIVLAHDHFRARGLGRKQPA